MDALEIFFIILIVISIIDNVYQSQYLEFYCSTTKTNVQRQDELTDMATKNPKEFSKILGREFNSENEDDIKDAVVEISILEMWDYVEYFDDPRYMRAAGYPRYMWAEKANLWYEEGKISESEHELLFGIFEDRGEITK